MEAFLKQIPIAAVLGCRRSGVPPLWSAASRLLLLVMVLGAALFSGCAHVKPWERDVLSRPGMQLDPDPLLSGGDDHIYFSREASKGGRGFGGGGCGCN